MADKFDHLVGRYEQARLSLEELLASDPDPSLEKISKIDREISKCFEDLTQSHLPEEEELVSRIFYLVTEIKRLSVESNLTQQLCDLITSDLKQYKDLKNAKQENAGE